MAFRIISLLSFTLSIMLVLMASRRATASDEAGVLLAFRAGLGARGSDMLASWNSSTNICSWEGVACNRGQRVVALSLPSYGLTGNLSPAIGNLDFLQTLNLTSNWFQGEVPSSIGRLVRLQTLDLSYNSSSMIPANLSFYVSLISLRLSNNQLHG